MPGLFITQTYCCPTRFELKFKLVSLILKYIYLDMFRQLNYRLLDMYNITSELRWVAYNTSYINISYMSIDLI